MVPTNRRRRARAPIFATALAVASVACGPSGPTGAPSASWSGSPSTPSPSRPVSPTIASPDDRARFDPRNVAVTLEPFVDGLDAPLAIATAADGGDRLFIAEQGGAIRLIKAGKLLAEPFVDLSAEISSGGERGLLGLAFHPDYPNDPRVFVDYTDKAGNTVVSSLTVDPANPDRLDPATELVILRVEQPFANHNGGALAFTPDGFLLIALGDGGGGGDPRGNGQSETTLLGKILRIDVKDSTSTHPYGIPGSNPFADGANGRRPEIWLTGLRNPWRMSIDRGTGDLWLGDVGQGDWEEIDVQRAGAPGGTNFGWNRMEGRHCFSPHQGCETPSLTLPVTDYGHDQGCTVIGGYVERAETPTALTGGYLFGDYCSGRLWAIDPASDTPRDPVVVGETNRRISAFGEDEAGALYAADIAAGEILKVVASAR